MLSCSECCEAPDAASMCDEPIEMMIIGSGPHALALSARLLQSQNTDSYTDKEHILDQWWKKQFPHIDWESRSFGKIMKLDEKCPPNIKKICVVAPEGKDKLFYLCNLNRGKWMAKWNQNFNELNIKYLRSTMVQHPDPFDLESLRGFTAQFATNSQQNPQVLCTPQLFQDVSHSSSSKRGNISI